MIRPGPLYLNAAADSLEGITGSDLNRLAYPVRLPVNASRRAGGGEAEVFMDVTAHVDIFDIATSKWFERCGGVQPFQRCRIRPV
jgi:hypothetical protein